MEKRSWDYRIETRYLYSDGSYKNSTFSRWKKRFERIKIYKEVNMCKYCGYRWTEEKEVNLDEATRPQTVYTKRTRYRKPRNLIRV